MEFLLSVFGEDDVVAHCFPFRLCNCLGVILQFEDKCTMLCDPVGASDTSVIYLKRLMLLHGFFIVLPEVIQGIKNTAVFRYAAFHRIIQFEVQASEFREMTGLNQG